MRRGLLVAATFVLAGCGGTTAQPPARTALVLLPDLVASPPSHVTPGTAYVGGRYHSWVGFDTRVTNRGAGTLDIVGHRPPDRRVMTADQLVHRTRGGTRVVRGIGLLRFTGGHHDHWHLLPFDDYELISADDRRLHIRGHKQGFCIEGFSVGVTTRLSKQPSTCGKGRPNALSVHERLGPGSADEYGRFVEGQSISLDRVPAGRYYIVLRVNGTRKIRESDYSNDVAAALIHIGYRGAVAYVRTLARCGRPPPCLRAVR